MRSYGNLTHPSVVPQNASALLGDAVLGEGSSVSSSASSRNSCSPNADGAVSHSATTQAAPTARSLITAVPFVASSASPSGSANTAMSSSLAASSLGILRTVPCVIIPLLSFSLMYVL